MDGSGGRERRLLGPQRVDEAIDGHRPVRVHDKDREEEPRLRRQRHAAARRRDPQGTEDGDLHAATIPREIAHRGGKSARDGRNRGARMPPARMLDPDSTAIGAPLERLATAAAHGPGTAPTRAQAAARWTEMNDANARPSEIQQRQDRPALGVRVMQIAPWIGSTRSVATSTGAPRGWDAGPVAAGNARGTMRG